MFQSSVVEPHQNDAARTLGQEKYAALASAPTPFQRHIYSMVQNFKGYTL
jgi:hypothetical protein